MAITKAEFDEICRLVCPHCGSGNMPTQRADTLEWTHDFVHGASMSHALCWAQGLRNSHFAKDVED